jgi:hypothetical protein
MKKSFYGMNENIIIYRKTTGGVAKYPGVSITALNKGDKEKMLESFLKLTLSNRAKA